MICSAKNCFLIPDDCVEPLNVRRILRFSATHDIGDLLAARVGCSAKACQATRKDEASRLDTPAGLRIDGLVCKPTHTIHL